MATPTATLVCEDGRVSSTGVSEEGRPDERVRPRAASGFEGLIDAVARRLPRGWGASFQLEDPLTRTLEEAATSDPRLETALLTLAPLPEAFTQPGDPWLLRRLGFGQARVIAFPGDRPYGRLLLLAATGAAPLDESRAVEIRALVAELGPALERARARHEDDKLSGRLRRVAEAELAEHFTEVSLGLLPSVRAAAVLAAEKNLLTVIRVRRDDGVSLEEYLRRTIPLAGSHLAALAGEPEMGRPSVLRPAELGGFNEGRLFAPLIRRLDPGCVETVPLEPGGRLAGSLLLFHRSPERPEDERAATRYLARALEVAFDRMRPERRQGMRLLYLQELLQDAERALPAVLETVVEEIVGYMGADAGLMALVDTESGSVLLSQTIGYGRRAVLPEVIPLAPPATEATSEVSSAAQVLTTGAPCVLSEITDHSPCRPVAPAIHSEIAVPLRLGGETVGLALVSSRRPATFLPEDARRFQLFADQVAVAVDNARLLEDLRRERGRHLARRQRRRFGFHPSVHADDIEYHFGNLVGSPEGAFGQVYRFIERVAEREDDTVLILGETGTGKEMIAHAIHNASPRRSRPLEATNFAALGGDPNLIQSELFGHEKGAFTGAVRRRRGAFERAHRSTLLIDELGDIMPSVQVKLLRVLGPTSRREHTRLGGEELIKSDVRVLAATNKDLKREMLAGRFREDLYYRLSALMVRVPPLRSRLEDIPLLVRHFLVRLSKGQTVRLRRGVFEAFQGYAWPGNVRQLESVLLRALVMFGAPDEISAEDVRQAVAVEEAWEDQVEAAARENGHPLKCPAPPPPSWFWKEVQEPWKARRLSSSAVRELLSHHLEETGGYYTHVAERLGVARTDYQRFLDFLKNSGLKVDHRRYRSRR